MARTRRLRITKVPQCRHSEKQGFVSYVESPSYVFVATCSNCGSSSAAMTASPPNTVGVVAAKEAARNDLMRIEAPPLVP